MKSSPLISIVDDDESVRESLESLLQSMGLRVSTFGGAEEFLEAGVADQTDCLILDMRLDGMSGPELQQELKKGHGQPPIVFITAHGTEALREKVLAEGAVECLLKPYSEENLLAAVKKALDRRSRSFSK
jgi:FixJ family two-component response regulator